MGWISPTGYIDADDKWNYMGNLQENAYDGDLETFAQYDNLPPLNWGNFLELTHSEISCSKIRFYPTIWMVDVFDAIDIDAFYNGVWNHFYEGVFLTRQWNEISLTPSQLITSFRFRYHNASNDLLYPELTEVSFYQEVATVTTEVATQIAYYCAIGNGTINSNGNATERGFETRVSVDYFGVGGDITWGIMGFVDEGGIVYHDFGQRTGDLIKRDMEEGDFEEGVFEDVLGYPSVTYDVFGTPDYMFNDMLEKCTSYTYRAYAIIGGVTYFGEWVAFNTLCDSGSEQQPNDDISEGNPVEPIIPITLEEPLPTFEPDKPEEIPYPPWNWDIPPWELPDYDPLSFVGDFYYKKPYTQKDLDELRKKCIIYNKNSIEFALVLRHNMNVLKESFNMATDYLGKDEFNDFTDLIPPQRLKELYLDPLEPVDFRDMINEFIRNTVDNDIAVNRNFNLIQEGLTDTQVNNEEGSFKEITSSIKTLQQDDPDVERMKGLIDDLNDEVSSNFSDIMYNLDVVRARLL